MSVILADGFGTWIAGNKDLIFAIVLSAAWLLPSPAGAIVRAVIGGLQAALGVGRNGETPPLRVDSIPLPPPDISSETKDLASDARNIPPSQRY
jgi:hypothetical protein